jgi:hypothetical protein
VALLFILSHRIIHACDVLSRGKGKDYIIPAFANIHVIMSNAPTRSVGLRPQRSTNRRAGMVMTTLMIYWILEESKTADPMLAIVKTY